MLTSYEFESQLINNAVELPFLTSLEEEAQEWFAKIAKLAEAYGPFNVESQLPSDINYLPTASSISLNAILQPERIIEALSSDVKQAIKRIIGGDAVCNTNISWLRRQYPKSFKEDLATAHSWHQDGAYGVDFMDENHKDLLLPMVTVWLPLHKCGETAPGIELIRESPRKVMSPSQLTIESIELSWPKDTYWRPTMEPGDALLIASHTIHRTYQESAMTHFRGCIELRFLPSKSYSERVPPGSFIKLFN